MFPVHVCLLVHSLDFWLQYVYRLTVINTDVWTFFQGFILSNTMKSKTISFKRKYCQILHRLVEEKKKYTYIHKGFFRFTIVTLMDEDEKKKTEI